MEHEDISIIFCLQAGANMIVSGTAVVKSDTPTETIALLRAAVEESIRNARL